MNACLDKKRKIIPFANVVIETIEDESATPDAHYLQHQQSKRVQKALQTLPEKQRAALILSYYEEISNVDAAEMLHMPLGAFQQLLFRARKNLKEQLLPQYEELQHGYT
jgi:RNA polymerase sigma-70 factor (ECF subfamily)